jgi:hypothetical protein
MKRIIVDILLGPTLHEFNAGCRYVVVWTVRRYEVGASLETAEWDEQTYAVMRLAGLPRRGCHIGRSRRLVAVPTTRFPSGRGELRRPRR